MNIFDVNSVRALPHRPWYERQIELAAWEGKKQVVLTYHDRTVAGIVWDILLGRGFTVNRLRSRNNETEFYFEVAW